MQMFLQEYDQYYNEVFICARQLLSTSSETKPVRLISLKFCVDVEFL